MQDGIGQTGAGTSDMRLSGTDLQHNVQKRNREYANASNGQSQIEVHEALLREIERHKESKAMRLEHLAKHYMR